MMKMMEAQDAVKGYSKVKRFLIWNRLDLPERVAGCLEDIAATPRSNPRRVLLIQQLIGYAVACQDFGTMDKAICAALIDVLHDER